LASSTRKPFAIGDKVFNQIMPAFEWAKAKETRIMNNVPIEKRGITVTLNPTNSHALRLLAYRFTPNRPGRAHPCSEIVS